jgi:guanylate kinase
VNSGPLLAVLTGPSAVGKDTLLLRLRDRLPNAHFAITATSRPPRTGEKDGVDYYFYTSDEFERMIERGDLLEYATVYGDWKGVPRAPIAVALRQGKDVLMRTDVQGARYIRSKVPGTVTIFVSPPSVEELDRRLRERGTDNDEQATVRRKTALDEMSAAPEFDYVVINDDLEQAVQEVLQILESERSRSQRKGVSLG